MISSTIPPSEAFSILPVEEHSPLELQQLQSDSSPRVLETELHEVFERLKWSVLDSPSEAQVFELDSLGQPQWLKLFKNSKTSATDEATTRPPRSRLHITLQPLHSWWHWHDAEIKHLRPEPLLIENMDGQPISVKQLIYAIHDYAIPLCNLLCECADIAERDWPKAKFHYELSIGGSAENTLEMPDPEDDMYLAEDTGEHHQFLEKLWSSIETRYRRKMGLQ